MQLSPGSLVSTGQIIEGLGIRPHANALVDMSYHLTRHSGYRHRRYEKPTSCVTTVSVAVDGTSTAAHGRACPEGKPAAFASRRRLVPLALRPVFTPAHRRVRPDRSCLEHGGIIVSTMRQPRLYAFILTVAGSAPYEGVQLTLSTLSPHREASRLGISATCKTRSATCRTHPGVLPDRACSKRVALLRDALPLDKVSWAANARNLRAVAACHS